MEVVHSELFIVNKVGSLQSVLNFMIIVINIISLCLIKEFNKCHICNSENTRNNAQFLNAEWLVLNIMTIVINII